MVFPNSQVYDYNLTALEGTYYRFAHLYLRMQIFNFFYDNFLQTMISNKQWYHGQVEFKQSIFHKQVCLIYC